MMTLDPRLIAEAVQRGVAVQVPVTKADGLRLRLLQNPWKLAVKVEKDGDLATLTKN